MAKVSRSASPWEGWPCEISSLWDSTAVCGGEGRMPPQLPSHHWVLRRSEAFTRTPPHSVSTTLGGGGWHDGCPHFTDRETERQRGMRPPSRSSYEQQMVSGLVGPGRKSLHSHPPLPWLSRLTHDKCFMLTPEGLSPTRGTGEQEEGRKQTKCCGDIFIWTISFPPNLWTQRSHCHLWDGGPVEEAGLLVVGRGCWAGWLHQGGQPGRREPAPGVQQEAEVAGACVRFLSG